MRALRGVLSVEVSELMSAIRIRVVSNGGRIYQLESDVVVPILLQPLAKSASALNTSRFKPSHTAKTLVDYPCNARHTISNRVSLWEITVTRRECLHFPARCLT
jgi:hypothetical protein